MAYQHSSDILADKIELQKQDADFRMFNIRLIIPEATSFGESVHKSGFELASEAVEDAFNTWSSAASWRDKAVLEKENFNCGAMAIVSSSTIASDFSDEIIESKKPTHILTQILVDKPI